MLQGQLLTRVATPIITAIREGKYVRENAETMEQ